jgi:hypothetical protein
MISIPIPIAAAIGYELNKPFTVYSFTRFFQFSFQLLVIPEGIHTTILRAGKHSFQSR